MSELSIGEVRTSKPIFVSGAYRSGTTFLTAMLGAHPMLRSSSNAIKFMRFCLRRYGCMSAVENRKRMVEETARRVAIRWGLDINVEAVLKAAECHDKPSYALLYDLLMRELLWGGESDSMRWVEKINVQWSSIPDFLDMFPNGRVVHIVRDPRDVTSSYKLMTFEPGNTYLDAAFNCSSSMESMYDMGARYSDRVKVLRAEDLAQRPESVVPELQAFLDLTPDRAMLDTAQLHAEGEDWARNTSHDEHYNQWPDGKPRWPKHLTRVEVMFVELITQPWLARFGYESSGYVPSSKEWEQIYALMDDDFLRGRFQNWFQTGQGAEGYRSDPYLHEMKIVFPERYAKTNKE